MDLQAVLAVERMHLKFIKVDKFFHRLELQGIFFNEKEKQLLSKKFEWVKPVELDVPENHEIFSISSYNSQAGSEGSSFFGVSGFLDWVGLERSPGDRLALNENYLFVVVELIKSSSYLKKNYFDRFDDLGELLNKTEEFLGIQFQDFENDFKFRRSTEELRKSDANNSQDFFWSCKNGFRPQKQSRQRRLRNKKIGSKNKKNLQRTLCKRKRTVRASRPS